MKVDGSCHCGKVQFEADNVDVNKVALCNCTDCQKLSGGAFRVNVFIEEKNLKFLQGQDDVVEYVKTSQSGNKRAQAFCPKCGTALYATSASKDNRMYGIRISTLTQCKEFVPKRQGWMKSRCTWLSDLDKIPGSEGN